MAVPPNGPGPSRQAPLFASTISKTLLVVLVALTTALVIVMIRDMTQDSTQELPSKIPIRPVASKGSIHPILEAHPAKTHSLSTVPISVKLVPPSSSGKGSANLRGAPLDLLVGNNMSHTDFFEAIKSVDTRMADEPHPIVASMPSNSSRLHTALLFSEVNTISMPMIQRHHDCQNQTLCHPAHLQLKRTFKVYYCKHINYGVRFYFLVREGLLLHPSLQLVDDMMAADYVVYLPESSNWDKSECNAPPVYPKLVVLDEGDYPHVFQEGMSNQFFLTFKRSYVKRQDGSFKGYMGYLKNVNILPMTYPVAEAYIKPKFVPIDKRGLEIVCSLRGGDHDPTRRRVKQFVEEYGKSRKIPNYVAGEVSHASRTTINEKYFGQMANAKIIVTSNPSHWEGDFRFCEALGSGALIFIDEMFVPRPHPFVHNVHVVYYNSHNKTDLFDKLDAVRSNPTLLTQMAIQGYIHGLTYHRATNLLDYIFRTVHVKEQALQEKIFLKLSDDSKTIMSPRKWGYSNHGFYMRYIAMQQQRAYDQGLVGKTNGFPSLVPLKGG